jgi:hypothetical protein
MFVASGRGLEAGVREALLMQADCAHDRVPEVGDPPTA